MNKQQVFDVVYKHLMQQGKKAMLPGAVSCSYRAHDGLKCAVGILIPDFEYTRNMETCGSVFGLLHHYPNALGFSVDEDMTFFLRNLQIIHDQCAVSNWRKHLGYVAASHNLTIPE